MHKVLGQIGSELWFPIETDSSHRVIMGGGGDGVVTFSRLFFIRSFSNLQVIITCMRARRSSKFGAIRPPTAELHVAALERKKILKTYNGKNGVVTFSQLFLIRSFSYLQVKMK